MNGWRNILRSNFVHLKTVETMIQTMKLTGVLHFQKLCFIYINVIVAHCHTFWTVTMEL